MRVFLIVLLSLTLALGNLFGQNGQAKLVERYEFDIKEEGENISNFTVNTLENNILINFYSQKGSNRNTIWTFKMMDQNLKEVKVESIEISKKFFFQSKYTSKSHLHVLLSTNRKNNGFK